MFDSPFDRSTVAVVQPVEVCDANHATGAVLSLARFARVTVES
jgi:hypothetical protein